MIAVMSPSPGAPARKPPMILVPDIRLYDAAEAAALPHTTATIRIRQNRYVKHEHWRVASPDQCASLHALAAALELPGLVLSHQSAARLLKIPVICATRGDTVEVTVARTDRNVGHLIRAHRSDIPPDTHTFTVDSLGIPLTVTTPAQTAIDLARHNGLATGLAAMDFVLHEELATRDELRERWDAIRRRSPRRSRPSDRRRSTRPRPGSRPP